MGVFGNILIFILALPFLGVCLNTATVWVGIGTVLSGNFAAVFLHPALLTLSLVAFFFGMARVGRFIRRNGPEHRDEALLQELEDRKDKSGD